MIFGNVKDLDKAFFWLPAPLKTAVAHLRDTDFSKLPAGNYDLQGKDIYVQVIDLTTKTVDQTRPEVHREYLDVQYLVSGREKIGVVPDTGRNAVAEDLLGERDLLFYAGAENETYLNMTPGCFAVFFPADVHRPACAALMPQPIRKVVVKVRLSLLTGA